MHKRYIGDGVYVEFDGFALVLTSENGVEILDRIVLEPVVYRQLVEYVDGLSRQENEQNDEEAASDS